MIEDAVLGPYRLIWEMFPAELAVLLIGFMALVSISFAVRICSDIEVDDEQQLGGYHPDQGYKFELEDLD